MAERLQLVQVERQPHQEKCGITAYISKDGSPIAPTLLPMQQLLKNRGNDKKGYALWENGSLTIEHQPGYVTPENFQVFSASLADRGIGHNRYQTSGSEIDTQPVVAHIGDKWVAVAHNGNIPVMLREVLLSRIPVEDHDKLTFDSAEITYAIAHAQGGSWKEKIKNALSDIPMAYALTILTDEGDMYGLVGPSGHWPLWVGENEKGIALASESLALPQGSLMRKVMPGELVSLSSHGYTVEQLFTPLERASVCALHEVYGANGGSFRTAEQKERYWDTRRNLGRQMAKEHKMVGDDILYVGVPNSGLYVAEGYTQELEKEASPVVLLNGTERSFIAGTVDQIQNVAATKYLLNPDIDIRGKKIVLLDDSVIRGTTMRQLVQMLRARGVAQIHIISGLPPVLTSCDYGYNIQESQGLLARSSTGIRSKKEMAEALGVDSISFISQEGLRSVLGDNICTTCMTGELPYGLAERQLTRRVALVQ